MPTGSSPLTRIIVLPFVAVALLAVFGIPAFFIVQGSREAWNDHVRRTTFVPVEATVLRSTIESRRISRRGGLAYTPRVTYRYTVNGSTYLSHQVFPLDEAYSKRWASDCASRFRHGQTVTAFVNPDLPGDSFLVARTSWLPYLFIGVGLVFPVGFTALARRRRNT